MSEIGIATEVTGLGAAERLAAERWRSLQNWVPLRAVGAELGVFKGHLSPYFLTKLPRTLYLVDPWYRLAPTWTWCKSGDPNTYNAFLSILRQFEREINLGQVVPVVDFSVPFLRGLEPHSLDFCYLDSSHSYEGTRDELPAIAGALKSSGLLLGDDWREDQNHRHHGVTRAVREWLDAGRAKILFVDKQQWGLRFLD